MVEIYFSEDKGLLDDKSQEFQEKIGSCLKLKNPSLEALELALFQTELITVHSGVIVDGFSGSESLLIKILSSTPKPLLLLFTKSPSDSILSLATNKDQEIPKLTAKTRRSYINNLLKKKSLKIKKNYVDIVKDNISSQSLEIKEIFFQISLMQKANVLNEENIYTLLRNLKKIEYFPFLESFFSEDEYEWLRFLNDEKVVLDKLLYAFSYKLLELYLFLSSKSQNLSPKDSASVNKMLISSAYTYDSYCKRFGSSFESWVNSFIIDLYFLVSELKYSSKLNLDFFKFFLLNKRKELENEY